MLNHHLIVQIGRVKLYCMRMMVINHSQPLFILKPIVIISFKTWQEPGKKKNDMQSCSLAVMQSCDRKAIQCLDRRTIRPHNRKTKSLQFHYLIPVIPKTWQETWQDF
jgi:hypothetical protein